MAKLIVMLVVLLITSSSLTPISATTPSPQPPKPTPRQPSPPTPPPSPSPPTPPPSPSPPTKPPPPSPPKPPKQTTPPPSPSPPTKPPPPSPPKPPKQTTPPRQPSPPTKPPPPSPPKPPKQTTPPRQPSPPTPPPSPSPPTKPTPPSPPTPRTPPSLPKPPPAQSPSPVALPSPSSSPAAPTKLSKIYIGLIAAASAFGLCLLLCLISLLRRVIKKKQRHGGLGMMTLPHEDAESPSPSPRTTATSLVILRKQQGTKGLDLNELMRGSAELLGKGSYGSSYKTELENGSVVVVKRLSKEIDSDRAEFESRLESISRVEHPLVMPLLGYYWSPQEKLLLSEYFPLGSLYDALHGSRAEPLFWDRRLKVAMDVAQALRDLHAIRKDIVHGDIRTSKIFLTREGCMISHMGIFALVDIKTLINGKANYLAPEVFKTENLTQESDIYSFGVLLMELLSRKTPSKVKLEQGKELVQWVQSVARVEWTEKVLDKELLTEADGHLIQDEILSLLDISIECIKSSTEDRASMAKIWNMISNIRPSLGSKSPSTSTLPINP